MRTTLRESEHLFRMALLFVVVGGAFLAARALMMPEDFGRYGHYRPGALDDAVRKPTHFAGAKACAECHDDVVAARVGGKHAGVNCEACHGALAAHAAEPTANPTALPQPLKLCSVCHAKLDARPAWFPQVDPGEHNKDVECTTCHDPHNPGM